MKQSMTHWYVQLQDSNNMPEIVSHSQDDETNELYYKFLTRKGAKQFADMEKSLNPNIKYRVVKCAETFDIDAWF